MGTLAAILSIVQQAIDDETSTSIISILSLLLRAPLDFLTKTVRNAVTRSVYEIDASGVLPGSTRKLAGSEQELLRNFMVKVIKDTEQLGPLVSVDSDDVLHTRKFTRVCIVGATGIDASD
jgi:hypothetical protein